MMQPLLRCATLRLKKLVACGILEQAPASDGSAYREYALTQKGRELFPVIVALRQWGESHLFSRGRETSSGSGQTHRKTLSGAGTQRERGNPFGERPGTGYCYELNEPLRRPPPLLLLPKYLPVGLAAIGIKAITLTLFPSGFQLRRSDVPVRPAFLQHSAQVLP